MKVLGACAVFLSKPNNYSFVSVAHVVACNTALQAADRGPSQYSMQFWFLLVTSALPVLKVVLLAAVGAALAHKVSTLQQAL